MQLTAQYSNHMRLGKNIESRGSAQSTNSRAGQGFNSYTHETRIDNAVDIGSSVAFNGPRTKTAFRDSAIEIKDEHLSTAASPSHDSKSLPPHSTTLARALEAPRSVTGNASKQQSRAPVPPDQQHKASQELLASAPASQPFHIVKPIWDSNQSVTYSSWQVDSLNEIADALNISSFARVKYATVEANVNASMIHESKLQDSQLKYVA